MKTAYVFFNGQLEGSREFYIKLIDEKKGIFIVLMVEPIIWRL